MLNFDRFPVIVRNPNWSFSCHAYRNQEWTFSQHAVAAARAGTTNDHGPAKGLIHDMIFRKDGKPTSHLFDVRDAIASNRTSSAAAGAADHGRRVGSSDWIGSSSRPLSRTMSAAASTGFALGSLHPLSRGRASTGSNGYHPNGDANTTSSDPLVTKKALGSRLEVHVILCNIDTSIGNLVMIVIHTVRPACAVMELQEHLEPKNPSKVIGEMCTGTAAKRTKASMEDNGGMPDLQLSLSPNVGGDSDKQAKKRRILSIALSEQEVDSDKMLPLSLSLSLRGGDSGGEGSGGDAGRLEAAIGSSSSKKAALGLSTLDLTMSIKALE